MNSDAAWTPLSDDALADTFRAAPIDEVRRRLVALNPGHEHRRLLATPTWDIGNYNGTNKPAIVATLIGGCTVVVNDTRQLRLELPMPRS
jgi:hypothetical protein